MAQRHSFKRIKSQIKLKRFQTLESFSKPKYEHAGNTKREGS